MRLSDLDYPRLLNAVSDELDKKNVNFCMLSDDEQIKTVKTIMKEIRIEP